MPTPPKKRKNGHPKGIFRDIFVAANPELAPFGMVFVYPPENFDQRPLGTIFGLIKIFDTSPESSFVANLLASVIKKEFFSRPSRTAYDSFEASLRKANLALAELARQGSVKWIGNISFAGGVIEKNNLHFSKLGTTSILLLRGGMVADIGAGMDGDLTENGAHPLKTFSDLSSGKVEIGDRLVFTTADLLEIFSLEEIRQNAARFSREEFPDIISASLTANSELSGAIVVTIAPEEAEEDGTNRLIGDPPKRRIQAAPPTNYPPQRMLRPQPAAPREIDLPYSPLPAVQSAKKENKIFISESDDILPKVSIKNKFFIYAKKFLFTAKNISLATGKNIKSLFGRVDWRRIFFLAKKNLAIAAEILKRIDFRKKKTRLWVGSGAIVILLIMAFSVFKNAGNINSGNESPLTAPAPNAAPAALNDINTKNIDNISRVAPLSSDSREIIGMGDSLFVLVADKSILKIDPTSAVTEKVDSGAVSGKFMLAAAMPDLNTIFILTADKKVISFTPVNKKFQENNIPLPNNLNASDIKTYLTYLYILDPNANQIYRFPRAESGFGDRQNWLKAGTDVKNTTSFAINEDLYVAGRNQITAYLQGKKDDKINFESPNTALAIDKIFTAPDLENIYILDNKNHRVIRYSKDGKITAQYFSSSIAGIKDFTVDEKNKSVYLQKADSITKFSME